jgi:hypothetical protein
LPVPNGAWSPVGILLAHPFSGASDEDLRTQ